MRTIRERSCEGPGGDQLLRARRCIEKRGVRTVPLDEGHGDTEYGQLYPKNVTLFAPPVSEARDVPSREEKALSQLHARPCIGV